MAAVAAAAAAVAVVAAAVATQCQKMGQFLLLVMLQVSLDNDHT